jgi:hypothetical protein
MHVLRSPFISVPKYGDEMYLTVDEIPSTLSPIVQEAVQMRSGFPEFSNCRATDTAEVRTLPVSHCTPETKMVRHTTSEYCYL